MDIEHFSQRKKRNANKAVIDVCDELGFNVINREIVEKHSHASYNIYNIGYPILFESGDIKPFLKVEMVFIQRSYPDEIKIADSYVSSWLSSTSNSKYISQYELDPFSIKVQTLERTLVDKVFALCDYYLRKETERNSRHIYDLACLLTKVELNGHVLKSLVDNVREDRKSSKRCVSAQDGIDIPSLLDEIIKKDFFKKDYIESTEKLILKPMPYEEAIKSLQIIKNSNIFKYYHR